MPLVAADPDILPFGALQDLPHSRSELVLENALGARIGGLFQLRADASGTETTDSGADCECESHSAQAEQDYSIFGVEWNNAEGVQETPTMAQDKPYECNAKIIAFPVKDLHHDYRRVV